MEKPPVEAIESLFRRRLITSMHRNKALGDPRLAELAASPSESDALVWLVGRDVMSEEEFEEMASNLRMTRIGAEYRECQELVDEATVGLDALRLHLNEQALEALRAAGLVDTATHEQMAARLPVDRAFGSPGAMLAWMSMTDLVSDEQMQALRDRVKSQAAFASGESAAAIVAQADDIIAGTHKLMRRAAVSALWRGTLPGPPVAWVIAFIAFLAWVGWSAFTPDGPPTCESDSIRSKVSAMLFPVHVKAQTDMVRRGHHMASSMPSLSDVREIGYARAESSRACSGTVSVGGMQLPYSFTITPVKSDQPFAGGDTPRRGYVVSGADARIVQARYGHIDEQGRFAEQALPVGRAWIEKAFRNGVESMPDRFAGGHSAATLERLRAMHRMPSSAVGGDGARAREIVEVEPSGPCRTLAPRQYMCPLIVEWNDPFLLALGRAASTVFEGDFTFERDAAGDGWHVVVGKFADEFRQASVAGRTADAAALSESPGTAASAP